MTTFPPSAPVGFACAVGGRPRENRTHWKLVSERLFWISRYSGDVEDGFPTDDQETAWKRYNDAVVTWNENYMVDVLLTEKSTCPVVLLRAAMFCSWVEVTVKVAAWIFSQAGA